MWTPVQKLKENPNSLRVAVNAMCAQCVCWDDGQGCNPSPRWLIGNCGITDCALWQVRPYQHRKGDPTPTSYKETARDSNSGE